MNTKQMIIFTLQQLKGVIIPILYLQLFIVGIGAVWQVIQIIIKFHSLHTDLQSVILIIASIVLPIYQYRKFLKKLNPAIFNSGKSESSVDTTVIRMVPKNEKLTN